MMDEKLNNPYILFLGTSHTRGSCKMGTYNFLDYKDLYTTIAGENLNIPVVNLGIPGTDNHQILQVLQDWAINGYIKNCLAVVAEVRSQQEGRIHLDILDTEINDNNTFSPIFRGRDYVLKKDNGIEKTTWLEQMHRQYSASKLFANDGKEYLKNVLQVDITDLELNDIYDYISKKTVQEKQSSRTTYELLLLVRSMLLTVKDIPFLWWTMRGDYHKKTYGYIAKIWPEVVQSNMLHVNDISERFWNMYGAATLTDEDLCKHCEHFKESGHIKIANVITNKLKKII